MKKLILLLLFIPLVSFGQKSNDAKLKSKVWMNGKAFWAPEGFEHQGNLVWRKENDLIVVASSKGSFNPEIFQETCEKGTESASYLMNDSYQLNGTDYQICYAIGANDMLIAQINILNDKIKCKKHKEDKRISYNHKSISKLILKRDTIIKEFRYKKTLGRRAPRLLELIIEDDNVSLYAEILELQMYGLVGAILKIPNKIVHTYYIVKNNNNHAVFFGDTDYTVHKRFKEIARKNLENCEEVLTKIENKEYKVKDIKEIVKHYNKKCSNNKIK